MAMRRMRHSERTAACLIHLAGVIPIWGALAMAAILWRYRGRSRPVVFHAQQALFFHMAMLLVFTLPLLVVGVGNMIAVLRPGTGSLVAILGWWGLAAVFGINAIVCVYGANAVIDGSEFNYPFFGKRLRPAFEEPPVMRKQREFHTYLTPTPKPALQPASDDGSPATGTKEKKEPPAKSSEGEGQGSPAESTNGSREASTTAEEKRG